MRAAAIVANLVQMVIVLFVFVLQGITMQGAAIAALFCLFIIAAFNLLVLLFSGREEQRGGGGEKKAIIKRRDFRVSYVLGNQPHLAIGDQRYNVLDISEGGARIGIGRHERLKKRMRCRIGLLCGENLSVKAMVLRREGNEAALAFHSSVEYRILLKEKEFLSDFQDQES